MDDLLEGVITSKHQQKKEDKPKGATDRLVQEAYQQAIDDAKKNG